MAAKFNWFDMTQFEALNGQEATQSEVDTFVELVRQGGAVDEHYVRQGLKRDGVKIVFAKIGGRTIGVAALKVPSCEYRTGLESKEKSGHPLPTQTYPFELGYVSVSPEHGGFGIGKGLVEMVLNLAKGNGVFATTGNPAMREGILPSFEFSLAGSAWENEQNEMLHLLIRPASRDS